MCASGNIVATGTAEIGCRNTPWHDTGAAWRREGIVGTASACHRNTELLAVVWSSPRRLPDRPGWDVNVSLRAAGFLSRVYGLVTGRSLAQSAAGSGEFT